MPSATDHAALANRNIDAYQAMPDSYPDWQAVILFYAAVHLVEILAARANRHNPDHPTREPFIRERHPSLFTAYHRLQQESEKARYMKRGRFAMNADQVEAQLLIKCVRFIERYVASNEQAARPD